MQQVRRKIPQFQQIRRTLEKKYTPDVQLEVAYQKRDTNEVTVVNTTINPRKRFPGNEYEKLYEVATVKVIN